MCVCVANNMYIGHAHLFNHVSLPFRRYALAQPIANLPIDRLRFLSVLYIIDVMFMCLYMSI